MLLWLLSERSESGDAPALEAAVNLSVAIADDISQALEAGNPAGLARLFDEFANHV